MDRHNNAKFTGIFKRFKSCYAVQYSKRKQYFRSKYKQLLTLDSDQSLNVVFNYFARLINSARGALLT